MTSLNQLIASSGTISLLPAVLHNRPSCPHLKLSNLDCLNFLPHPALGKPADFSFLSTISIPKHPGRLTVALDSFEKRHY